MEWSVDGGRRRYLALAEGRVACCRSGSILAMDWCSRRQEGNFARPTCCGAGCRIEVSGRGKGCSRRDLRENLDEVLR